MPDAVSIILNGDPFALDGDPRLTQLLDRLNMKASRVAVEINGEVVPKSRYERTVLKAGDRVEIINFVGGG
ncbi:MAG TPA: sulfur carrier protein ThiS [Candidatus Binataceae bacterium]